MSRLFIVLAAGFVSLVALEFLFAPYAWICLIWLVVCVLAAIRIRRPGWRALAINSAAVLLVLGGFELGLYHLNSDQRAQRHELVYEKGGPQRRSEDHELLGWVPIKGRRVGWRKYSGERLIYDVAYRINGLGLRNVPSSNPGADDCILFFGGSFTFGDGINDEETAAHLVGVGTGRRFQIFNFGYPGYGPHQMLALLERGAVVQNLQCRLVHVIFQGIPAHTQRVAGKAWWDRFGPKYLLTEDGTAVYQGPFYRRKSFELMVLNQIQKSFVAASLARRTTDEDVALTVAVVDKARNLVKRRFPGSSFHVIFWDYWDGPRSDTLLAGYRARGLRSHRVADIFPRYYEDAHRYRLAEDDIHPNALANRLIADYISRAIVAD